jgi:hypothetical protein
MPRRRQGMASMIKSFSISTHSQMMVGKTGTAQCSAVVVSVYSKHFF